jgi:3-oxoadipate enol-lactonase
MALPHLHFVEQGQGPLLVLSHALGLDLTMWDAVAARLEKRFTVLRYDHRGHGKSSMTGSAFTIEDLADDAAALIRSRTEHRAIFVGLSMGGMTAQALAVRAPEILSAIVIANSSDFYPDRSTWATRVARVRADGVEVIANGAVDRWLTPAYAATAAGAAKAASLRSTLVHTDAGVYAAACEAVAAIDFRESNRRIAVPTLVVAGAQDLATPPSMSEAIANAIPGAKLATVDAAHVSAAEKPAELAALIEDFVANV